jgi:hypothetical protein
MFGRLRRFGVPSPSQRALASWQLEDIALESKRDWEKDRMMDFNPYYRLLTYSPDRKRLDIPPGRIDKRMPQRP